MSQLTRRHALGLAAGAAVSLTAAALTAAEAHAAAPLTGKAAPEAFDEVFQGRHIQGLPTADGPHHGGGYAVFIDGRELHVMRNADGTWISVVNHYAPMHSPRLLTRAAVVDLQGADLVPFATR
ncbi:tyrosinase cofactor [Streptomyces sp. NPDC059009]|uniref:apotyrosinase chaperone MelC1 n=1 Tax=Streptomyces sp. NPDC059009 TaxID=3346694 RepID=UPI0036A6BEFF